jgi:hypothetical protein
MAANANKTHFPRVGGNIWVQSFYNQQYPDVGITGNVFWVSSGGGTDTAGYGFSPEAPFASIAFACTQAKADNGDLILVMPGHTETIGSVASTMSVAGLTVRGLGIGRQRGQVVYNNAAGYFSLDFARTCIDNLTFVGTGVASLTQMVGVSAADCTIQNCEFEHANATNQAADVIITTAAANRLFVQNCYFHGTNNAGTNHAISIVGGTDSEVQNNFFQGAYHISQGVIRTVTTDAVNLIVGYNIMQNLTASNTKAVVLTASTTGQLSGNFCQILSGTAPFTGAAASWVGQNYYANAVATAGTLI